MSKKFKFRNILNKIDLYGLLFPLRYKAHYEFNTLCGISLSILTIITVIFVIILFLINNFSRNQFSIIQSSEYVYEKKIINFSNVPILFGLFKNGNAISIESKYLSIFLDKNDHYSEKDEFGFTILRRESKGIKLEKCNLNKHFNNDSEIIKMIKEIEFENFLCIVPGQNLTFGGRYGDTINGFDMLEIHLVKCENKTYNNNCVSKEELDEFIENLYIYIYYINEDLDHHNKINPVRKHLRSEFFSVVSNSVKRYYYYFLPGEYISDNGYVFEFNEKYEFFEYEKTLIDFVDEEDQSYYSNKTFIEISIVSDNKFIRIERSYPKIQDSLGNIGGWIRVILVICQIISDFFSEKIFLLDIINKIISISEQKHFKSNHNSNIINKIPNDYRKEKINNFINDNSSQNKIQISRTSRFNMKLINNTTNEEELKKKNNPTLLEKKLKISLIEYIFPFCLMEKYNKFSFLILYKKFIYKNISLEVLIPIIERLYKFDVFRNNSKNRIFLSKMNQSFFPQRKYTIQ